MDHGAGLICAAGDHIEGESFGVHAGQVREHVDVPIAREFLPEERLQLGVQVPAKVD